MQARGRPAMCHACTSEGMHAPFPPPSPCASPPMPFIPCLPLCLPLIHLMLTICRQGTPNKAPVQTQGISTKHMRQEVLRARTWTTASQARAQLTTDLSIPQQAKGYTC